MSKAFNIAGWISSTHLGASWLLEWPLLGFEWVNDFWIFTVSINMWLKNRHNANPAGEMLVRFRKKPKMSMSFSLIHAPKALSRCHSMSLCLTHCEVRGGGAALDEGNGLWNDFVSWIQADMWPSQYQQGVKGWGSACACTHTPTAHCQSLAVLMLLMRLIMFPVHQDGCRFY